MNTPTLHDGIVTMPFDEFEQLLENAAQRGARHIAKITYYPLRHYPGMPTRFHFSVQ